ncbi:MAG: hypothetical protein ACMXYC_01860 [Candidatus Woesearchaeota archaeon]
MKKEQSSEKKRDTKVLVLGILVIILLGVVIFTQYNTYVQNKELQRQAQLEEAFSQGGITGYEQAVVDLLTLAEECQPIPVVYENTSVELIALECLQQ